MVVQALLHHATAPDLKAIGQDIGIEGDVVKDIDELAGMVARVAASGYPQGPIPVSRCRPRLCVRSAKGSGKAQETLSPKGVREVGTRVVDGDPAGNIIAAAEHEKADLVVMGRWGLGNVAGLVMGRMHVVNRRNGKKFLDCANEASPRSDGSRARRNGCRNSTAWAERLRKERQSRARTRTDWSESAYSMLTPRIEPLSDPWFMIPINDSYIR